MSDVAYEPLVSGIRVLYLTSTATVIFGEFCEYMISFTLSWVRSGVDVNKGDNVRVGLLESPIYLLQDDASVLVFTSALRRSISKLGQ